MLERWLPARRDGWVVLGLGLLLLGLLAPWLGVWEPWEAAQASVLGVMGGDGHWLQVQVAQGRGLRAVAELPYGWWPLAASTAVFGLNEVGLRLPGILVSLPALLLVFQAGTRHYGRLAGWLAALSLLSLPLFVFHAHHALGGSLAMAMMTFAVLGGLRRLTAPEAGMKWAWLSWFGVAGAGLVLGVPGVVIPLAALATGALTTAPDLKGRVEALRRIAPPVPALLALGVVAVGWWRAAAHQPDGGSLAALLLWTDPLGAPALAKAQPSFEAFTHQIGFGLFPLGAILPLAAADLLWGDTDDDDGAGRLVGAVAFAWFAAAFLFPAVTLPFGQAAVCLGAPAVALLVGPYLAKAVKSPPQPLLVLVAVVLVALLDSNLKHETHSLADAILGTKVDEFPPKLPFWGLTRVLSMALLAVLLIFQGRLDRWIAPTVRFFGYPRRGPAWLEGWLLGLSVIAPLAVLGAMPRRLERLLLARGWGSLQPSARKLVIFGLVWIGIYGLLWLAWRLRAKQVGGRSEGVFASLGDRLQRVLRWPGVGAGAMVVVLGGWAAFHSFLVDPAMTRTFSQKDIVNAYGQLAKADEPLFRYGAGREAAGSFYTRDLEILDDTRFKLKSKEAARFFAIIPRARLAAVNAKFREVTQRTLPVLDDRSHRYRLVSNLLLKGEVDKNPIRRALLDALPKTAHPMGIRFEDKVELAGWELVPRIPHPGSRLKIVLYWRALKTMKKRWKVFVHLDAPGQRIHGDHDPVEGLFPTNNWAVGDLVRDEHEIVVKKTISRALFTFYVGLYQGSKRMEVKVGDKDKENRAKLGKVQVR